LESNTNKNNVNIVGNGNQYLDTSIYEYNDEIEHYTILKLINNQCESPLEKINYFITNDINTEDIRYICSDDSNLYFMNLYINIIPIITLMQTKDGYINDKNVLLKYYGLLNKIYDCLTRVDLMNDVIFINKNWELLDYFDLIGLAAPMKLLFEKNCTPIKQQKNGENNSNSNNNDKTNQLVKHFQLAHHTPYNFMRQEQSAISKKTSVDYVKTREKNLTNIYYNLKRFRHINAENIKKSEHAGKKRKPQPNTIEGKYYIDRYYIKILDKFDELLA
jgi:hypothetical protein